MTNFSYDPPDEKSFLAALKKLISKQGTSEAKEIMAHTLGCSITSNGQFTKRRWNEVEGTVSFSTKIDAFDRITDKLKNEIMNFCDSLMPSSVGIEIQYIDFVPPIDEETPSVAADVSLVQGEESIVSRFLEKDIIDTGSRLSQIYNYITVRFKF